MGGQLFFLGRTASSTLLVLVLCSSACSSSSTGRSGSAPSTGELHAFSYLTNVIPVPVTVGTASGWAVTDTGNPWTLLDPSTFPAVANVPSEGGTIPSMVVASQTVANPFVFGLASGDVQEDSNLVLNGNVGCSVLCGFVTSFNYREVALSLGITPPPSGLGDAVTQEFSFEGGGTEDGVVVPRSRVVVHVALEGNDYSMILDTGATAVTVSQAAFSTLTSDGRVTIDGGTAQTTSGTSSSSLTRAASVIAGGVEVDGVVIAHDSSFDDNLEQVSADVGHTIDGSLGGTFLHDFYVTIDYGSQKFTLARYSDLSFVLDPARHIGLALEVASAGVYVVGLVSGDAAAQGVEVGDTVTAIDGQDLSSLSLFEAVTLLFGSVGTTKVVTFGAATNVANSSVPILVEELLPLTAATKG